MHYYLSRNESRQERLYAAANKHQFELEDILYPNEVTKLEKQGFTIKKLDDFDVQKNLGVYLISWSNPFIGGVPRVVFSYCIGLVKAYPFSKVDNFAKELFILAYKS